MVNQAEGPAKEESKDADIPIEEIFKKCLDAPGYVVFAGTLANVNGEVMLNFDYKRFHLNIEDVRIAFKRFEKVVLDDFNSLG